MEFNKVGILGSGAVGQTLANGFIKHGYEVMMGSRTPDKLTEWKTQAGSKASSGTFSEAAAFGDLLLLAVKGTAAVGTIAGIGAGTLAGKTVIDVTNPIADAPPVNGVIKFFTTLDNSLMEQLQAAAPEAHFVKAFNSIGNAFMVNPKFKAAKPAMFICGNNEESKKAVAAVVSLFGFDVQDMGKAEAARAIEPLCMLWCIPGILRNDWAHAFAFLKPRA
jgi:8-hydroxy-5-deazaflavin:NADPH oxidoreductase